MRICHFMQMAVIWLSSHCSVCHCHCVGGSYGSLHRHGCDHDDPIIRRIGNFLLLLFYLIAIVCLTYPLQPVDNGHRRRTWAETWIARPKAISGAYTNKINVAARGYSIFIHHIYILMAAGASQQARLARRLCALCEPVPESIPFCLYTITEHNWHNLLLGRKEYSCIYIWMYMARDVRLRWTLTRSQNSQRCDELLWHNQQHSQLHFVFCHMGFACIYYVFVYYWVFACTRAVDTTFNASPCRGEEPHHARAHRTTSRDCFA